MTDAVVETFDMKSLLGTLSPIYGRLEGAPIAAMVSIQHIAREERGRASAVSRRHDIHLSKLYVMLLLQRSTRQAPLRAIDLGSALNVTRGAISKILDQLEEQALVERITGVDRRSFCLILTPAGMNFATTLRTEVDSGRVKNLFSALSDSEWEHLNLLLAKIQHRGGFTQ